MAKNPKIHLAKAWAVVSKRGKIAVDTCSKDRRNAEEYFTEWNEQAGDKIRRVTVVVEMKP